MNPSSALSPKSSTSYKQSLRQSNKSNKSLRGSNSDAKKKDSGKKPSKASRPGLGLSEDNEKIFIVTTIKEEIIQKALQLIYEKYLEKQTVFFVSHCSQLAWKSLIEWNYQRKDKGGLKELKTTEHLDVEPNPSPKDSWAGNSIPIVQKHKKDPHLKAENKSLADVSELITVEDYSKAAEELTQISLATGKQSSVKLQHFHKKVFQRPQRKSDEPLLSSITQGKATDLKKDSYELPSPVPLQGKYFPSSRVEVKYSISPATRGQVTKKEPKVKTIHLKRNIESPEANGDNLHT